MRKIQLFCCSIATLSTFYAPSFANFGRYNNELYLGGKLSVNNNKYSLSSTMDAKKSIALSEGQIKNIEKEIELIEKEINAKLTDISKDKKQIENLNVEISQSKNTISQSKITLQSYSNELQVMKDKLQLLQKEIDAVINTIPRNDIARITQTIQDYTAKIKVEKDIIDNATQLIEQNKKLQNEINGKIQIKENELAPMEKKKLEQKYQIAQLESKIKSNQIGIGSSTSKTDTSVNLGLMAGFQGYKDNFVFGGGLEIDLGNNNINGDLKAKSNFSYSLMGRAGYQFYPDIAGYTSLGFKFARYNISTVDFEDNKNVKYFVFGVGMEKRFNRDLGVFAEFNYATSMGGDMALAGLNKDISFATFQFAIGARYYFDADYTMQTVKSFFRKR